MNKKGLTLIEIIIAIAILGIIASVFLASMTTYFDFLSRGKGMTQEVFEGQDNMEENIEIIKSKIFNDEEVTSSTAVESTYTLFTGEWAEREVKGYLTEVTLPDSRELTAVIGSEQIKYPVPVAEDIELDIRINNVPQAENYEYVFKENLSLRGNFGIDDPESVHLTNRHEWFVSRLGFNIPIEEDGDLIEEEDIGRLYPVFPNDYDLIPIEAATSTNEYSSVNTFEEEYTGRHIVYTVTPFATSGKKGETVFSQPVFLHGPTITNDLVLHLDANMISKDTSISNISYSGETILVNSWEDLSDSNNNTSNISSAKPILEEVQYQNDAFSWGKSITQNGNDSTIMRISSFSDSPDDEMTLIFVAKISETNTGDTIISSDSWNFGWNGSGNLTFNYGGDPATAALGKGIDSKWHVFTSVVSGGTVDFRIDGNDEDPGTTGGGDSCDSDPLTINLNGVDIAEILIYDNNLNTTNLDKIESQIINKYDPDPADITTNIMYIKSLPDRTIVKGSIFSPPNPVEAVMTNGTTQNVNVTWNSSVDTSTPGIYNISADADIDDTKSVNLTVNVVGIDYIEHHATPPITIEKNTEDYSLPTSLNAKLTDGSDKLVGVTWTSNEVDISVEGGILKGSEIGEYTSAITATANIDDTKSISYDVNVEKSYVVTFVDYNDDEIKIQNVAEGDSATAPADPNREGYDFAGWDKPFDNITSDLTVRAQYDPIFYIVRFVDYDNSLIVQRTVQHGEGAYPPSSDPTRTGYTFTGWNNTFDNVTSDLTVKAQYEPIFHTVRFIDHDNSLIDEISVQYGEDATAPADPTRTGYEFLNWSRSFTNVTSDLTVTAQYVANEYTLTLDDNFSGGSITTKTITFDSTYGFLRDPSRSGYDFKGWYTSSSEGTEVDGSSKVTTPDHHTLYAQWSKSLSVSSINSSGRNSFSLTFNNPIATSTNPGAYNWSNSVNDSIVSYSYSSWWGGVSPGNYSIDVTDIYGSTITVNLRLRREGSWWSGYDYYWELR